MDELTKAQLIGPIVSFTRGSANLAKVLPASYKTYRAMRKDPTIALARSLSVAPIIAAEWGLDTLDGATDEMIALIDKVFMPMREPLLNDSLLGGLDFGWQGFEKVFDLDADNRLIIKKFKPLLPDITTIMVETETGAFAGFKQRGTLTVPLANSFLVPFRVEGTDWYGNGLLENARASYNDWQVSNESAKRYDAKVAGTHTVIHYPVGVTDGKDNAVHAAEMLSAMESSGGVTIPYDPARFTKESSADNDMNNLGWKIELLSDTGPKQTSFVNRNKYLDVRMVRAMLFPERAILEGQFGTKAEAGVHGDIALTNAEVLHNYVVRHINWHCVNQLLVLNWGETARDLVKLKAVPLIDEKLAWFREVYIKVLSNPGGFLEEFAEMDTDTLKTTLGVPSQDRDENRIIDVPLNDNDTDKTDVDDELQ